MKKTLVLFMFLLAAGLSCSGQYERFLSYPISGRLMLKQVVFPDARTGYAVGDSGLILKTTDRGDNWERQVSGTPLDLNCVYFVDTYNGYAAGNNSAFLKTTDGGQSWITLATNSAADLNAVFFSDLYTGYAVGNNFILQTMDGGNTWSAYEGDRKSVV